MAELKKLGDPVVIRYKGSFERPLAFETLGQSLQHYRKALDLYSQKVATVVCIVYVLYYFLVIRGVVWLCCVVCACVCCVCVLKYSGPYHDLSFHSG